MLSHRSDHSVQSQIHKRAPRIHLFRTTNDFRMQIPLPGPLHFEPSSVPLSQTIETNDSFSPHAIDYSPSQREMVWKELVRKGLAGPRRLVHPEGKLDQWVEQLLWARLRLFHREVHLDLMARTVRLAIRQLVLQDLPDLADRQFLEDPGVRRDLGHLAHPADPQGPERLALAALRKQSGTVLVRTSKYISSAWPHR